jgi:hypothetical protein
MARDKRVFRALWERHQRGYLFIGALLFALSVALFKTLGWVTVAAFFVLLMIALELLYRQIQSFVKKHNERWWAKPRREIPRAYASVAAMIVLVLVESEFARYWLIATLVGSVLAAAAIHLHRTYEGE